MIYSQLIQFSLTAAQDSIQAAIASEAHVSSLRIVDIFLASPPTKVFHNPPSIRSIVHSVRFFMPEYELCCLLKIFAPKYKVV